LNFDEVGKQMGFAFRNHVVQVCAKGNEATEELHYPSDFKDEWILSIAGSGDEGEFYEGVAEGSGSNYGNGVDLMAPYGFEGVTVYTLDNLETDSYKTFGGTSGSAPQVAGVAALMHSEVNNNDAAPHFENLTHEDVEAILQITADEKSDDPCTTDPYDNHCGWGMLDATEALEVVEKPKYKVLHVCNEFNVTDDDLDEVVMTVLIPEAGSFGVSAGYYCADRYKITRTSSHALSATSEILNNWILPSMSNVLKLEDAVEIICDDPAFTMTAPTLSSTTAEGYIYYLKQSYFCGSGLAVNKWIPIDPNTTKAKFCYSLHIYDEFATEIDGIENNVSITIFPNPATDFLNISSDDFIATNILKIQITDITGKIAINNTKDGNAIINNFISIPVNQLATGVYVFSLNDGEQVITSKFVKL